MSEPDARKLSEKLAGDYIGEWKGEKPTPEPDAQRRIEIEVLAYAVERLTVEVQELAVALGASLGMQARDATLKAMGDVNRRLVEIFPEPDPPRLTRK